MSKRKLLVDSHRGDIALGQRPSLAHLQFQARNVICGKHVTMNVRPTSNCKVVQNHNNAKRSCADSTEVPQCNAVHKGRINLLKSRVDSASGFEIHTPPLKDSPAKSVGKSDALGPNFSSPLSTEDLRLCPDEITSMTVPPSHGHGDSMKVHSIDELIQQPQQQQHVQQSSNQAVTVSQQHVPIEQHVNRANQSELSVNKQLSSLAIQLHRPFVPHAMHGSTLRELSMSKAEVASAPVPVRKSSTLSIKYQGECQQPEYSTSTDQAHRFRSLIPQQKLQVSQQLVAHRVKDDVRTTLRACNPLEGDGILAKPAHKEYPAAKDYNTVCQPPVVSRKNLHNQQTIVNVGQPMTVHDITCSDISEQREEAMQPQRSYQAQQWQQYMNWQGQSAVNSMQNVRKMHQLMKNNMIRQRQMQQRVLSQQQQMSIRVQQQIAPQSMVCHMRTSTQGTPVGSKSFRDRCMYEEKITKTSLDSHQGSAIIPSQHCHPSQTAMPHYEMLMQQRSIGDQTLKVCPQNACLNNHPLTVANSNVNDLSKRYPANKVKLDEEIVSPRNVPQCGNFKLDHSQCQLKDEQRTVDQQTRPHGQETVPCLWNGKSMDTYSPSLYAHQMRNPISMQQYSTTQKEQDVSMRNSEVHAIHGHPRSKCQQLRPHQEYEPMSKDQHVQIMEHFNQPRTRFQLRNIKKKYADFTSAMIRDQELLVLNMRQQRIPEDTMRRQFDALLGEQRRFLTLFDQAELAEIKNDAPLCRNPRISIEDERPGWMGRITPSRNTIQQVQRSRRSASRRVAGEHREEQRHDSDRAKQYVETQQHTIQQLSDNTQCTTIVAHQQLNPSHMDNCQLHPRHSDHWKCNAGRTPQATLSWSQQGNYRSLVPLQTTHNNQPCDISAAFYKGMQQRILQQRQPSHEQHGQHRENDQSARNNFNISGQQRDPNIECDEPSSLLKLRKYNKFIRPQRQNNGLQKIVQGMLKPSESSEYGKGLGCVMNMGNKMKAVRFNGIQDPRELEKLSPPPVEYLEKTQPSERPKISANGLLNTRNADNPASPPKRFTDKTDRLNMAPLRGYPSQCHPGKRLASEFNPGSQNMMAEKENARTVGTVRQQNDGTLFQDCGQAHAEKQQLSQWRNVVDDPVESMAIFSDGSNLLKPHGNVSIIPYEVNGSQAESHGAMDMDQFYCNQQNSKVFARNDTTKASTKQPAVSNGSCSTAQIPRISLDPVVKPELQDVQSKIMADFDRNKQDPAPIVRTEVTSDQSAMLAHDAQNVASTVANAACENGQPEIRQPRMIGGFTYLARKVDYIQNPSLIAPNSLITSKFLQPLISFN